MDERSKVDKYLCTVCGHRHSNGWYCKHSIDAKDATIAALRAEVERLKKQKKYFSSECVRKGTEILRLSVANADANAELTQLREDRRVLGDLASDAVSGLRYLEQNFGRALGVGWDRVYQKATDASNALERANG